MSSSFASMDSANLGQYSTVVFAVEEQSHRSGPVHLKPVLFKGHLSSLFLLYMWLEYDSIGQRRESIFIPVTLFYKRISCPEK